MKSHEIASLVPQPLRVSAQQIFQFIGAQAYPQSDDVLFFQRQLLSVAQEGRLHGSNIPRFSTLLTQLSQSPEALQNPHLQQHFRILQTQLSQAVSPTVPLPQASSQSSFISLPEPPKVSASTSGRVGQATQTIGKYQVIRKLGEGGNGIVFLALNPLTEQNVALKCLAGGKSPEHVSAIRDEARVAARINHPNCVKVRDMVVDEKTGGPVIVSDFVDGLNGRDFFELEILKSFKGRRLPPRAALLMMEQMVRGVRAAHKTGIVHRDIKPENFLMTNEVIEEIKALANAADASSGLISVLERRRGDAWILLSDWGLALEKKGLSLTTSKTFDLGTVPLGKQGGTLVYMPIEQIEGSNIGRKSDVFALGLVLYELLTGATALEARSFAENVANDPNMTAQAFLVAVASSNARHSIDPSKDPNLRFLEKQKSLMKLLQAMTTRDRQDRLSSSGLETAILDLLEDRRPRFNAVSARQAAVEDMSESVEGSGTAILFLQGTVLGLVLLLVSLIGFAYFSKSSKDESEETSAPKAVMNSENKESDSSPTETKKTTDVAKGLTSDRKDLDAKKEFPPKEEVVDKTSLPPKPEPETQSPKDPTKPEPPPKKEGFAQFRAKYQQGLSSSEPLVVTEERLTKQELKFVTQYSGRRLILNLKNLSPPFASTLAQCQARILVFTQLSFISQESMKNLGTFRGFEVIFSKLKTLSPETARAVRELTFRKLKFDAFEQDPSLEAISEVRAGLLNANNPLQIHWPKQTIALINHEQYALRKLIEEKRTNKGPGGGPRKNRNPNGPLTNAEICRQIEAQNLSNVSKLTQFSPGIPALIVRFAHKQRLQTLDLRGLTFLKEPYAHQLSAFQGALILCSVKNLSDECARLISKFKGSYLDLSGVPKFSRNALKSLAQTRTILAFSTRSPKVEGLEILCSGQLKGLLLHRLESLDARQSACLASSKLSYLSLGFTSLDPVTLGYFKRFQGTIEFPVAELFGAPLFESLIDFQAREVRLSGLKKIPMESRRFLTTLPKSKKQQLRSRLVVAEAFKEAIQRLLK